MDKRDLGGGIAVNLSQLPIESKDIDPVVYFQEVIVKGDKKPEKRYGSSISLDGEVAYLFGGSDPNGSFYNDIWSFSFATNEWAKINAKGILPKGRHFHTVVKYQHSLWIFGGKSNGYQNDFFEFDLVTHTWSNVVFNGRPPSARFGHSANIYAGKMYIFGGYDTLGSKCNDLIEYNFETSTWTKITPVYGSAPEIMHHSAVIYQGSLYVFAGQGQKTAEIFEYRFSTSMWAPVIVQGKKPTARWGHRAHVYGDLMYVFGGSDSSTTYSDLSKFNFETRTWDRQITENVPPRNYHALFVYNEKLMVFGGTNSHQFLFDDIWELPFNKFKQKTPDTFASDMKKLILDPRYSDVTIHFPKENQILNGHRCILTARCDLFSAMLERSGMQESSGGKIVIEDFSYETFRTFLEYLYTGTLPEILPFDLGTELLHLADQYLVGHLKHLCEIRIQRYINKDNVVEFYELSKQLQAAELQQFCLKFLLKHYKELILDALEQLASSNSSLSTSNQTSSNSNSTASQLSHLQALKEELSKFLKF